MPCVSCGYQLRGLSIREACPECGLPLRATLLALVDPMAPELAPVHRPRIRVVALLLWVILGMFLLVLTWGLRVDDALSVLSSGGRQLRALAPLGPLVVVGMGLGTLAFVGGTREFTLKQNLMALCASVLHLPLGWLYWRMEVISDHAFPVVYFDAAYGGERGAERALLALGFNALLALITLLIRPAAREFVKRSAVMRRRAVDRQTLLMMTASLAIASMGQALLFLSMTPMWHAPSGLGSLGTVMVGLGSVLLTMAAFAAAYDSCALMPLMIRQPRSLADVFTPAASLPESESLSDDGRPGGA